MKVVSGHNNTHRTKRAPRSRLTVDLSDLAVPEVLLDGELLSEAHTSHQAASEHALMSVLPIPLGCQKRGWYGVLDTQGSDLLGHLRGAQLGDGGIDDEGLTSLLQASSTT